MNLLRILNELHSDKRLIVQKAKSGIKKTFALLKNGTVLEKVVVGGNADEGIYLQDLAGIKILNITGMDVRSIHIVSTEPFTIFTRRIVRKLLKADRLEIKCKTFTGFIFKKIDGISRVSLLPANEEFQLDDERFDLVHLEVVI